jgi:hypothetical protein
MSEWLDLQGAIDLIRTRTGLSIGSSAALLQKAGLSGELRARGHRPNDPRGSKSTIEYYEWGEIDAYTNTLTDPRSDGARSISEVEIWALDLAAWIDGYLAIRGLSAAEKPAWPEVGPPSNAEKPASAPKAEPPDDMRGPEAPPSGISTNRAKNAEEACLQWLKALTKRPPNKDVAYADAQIAVKDIGPLSRKAFERVWPSAVPIAWLKAGRRKGS